MEKKTTPSPSTPKLDEPRRLLIREAMSQPVWKGVERGVYEVELKLRGSVRVEIELQEAVLLRQVDRVLQRVVDQNRRVLERMAGSGEPRALLEKAWFVLEPVRCTAYCDGEYRMTFPGDETVSFGVTEWDGALLQRYDRLLKRIYHENQESIEGALRVRSRPTVARCEGLDPSLHSSDEVPAAA